MAAAQEDNSSEMLGRRALFLQTLRGLQCAHSCGFS